MTSFIKQSATITIRLGPFLDKTDGVTEETGLSPTVEVSKNHAAFGARNSATAIAHDAAGWYSVELNGTDTGTLGPLIVKSDDAANHLPVWREFLVVTANVYDSMVAGTDVLTADVTQWNGTNVATPDTAGYPKVTSKTGTGTGELSLNSGIVSADAVKISGDQTAADNLEAAADGTGYNLGNGQVVAASVTGAVGSVAAGGLSAASFAANAIAAAALAADAITKIQAGLSTLTQAQVNAEADAALADVGLTTTVTGRVDAAISTRSTYAGADTAGTTTLLSRLTELRAGYLDNLSAGAVALEATAQEIKGLVTNISTTGAAINDPADSFTLTTGTQSSGTFSSTATSDNTRHVITAASNTIDCYYEFQIGADGVPVSVSVEGCLVEGAPAGGDTIALQAYNWVTPGWDTIDAAFWTGITSATDAVKGATLYTSHVGSGANNGLVRVRFYSTTLEAGTALHTDQIYVSYAVVNRSVGYAMGAVWLDTNASNTNTVEFVDGVADNPVSTLAAARALTTSLGLRRIHVASGSSITLASATEGLEIFGEDYTIALGGQSISGTHFSGATISGVASGASAPSFHECSLGTVTLPPCEVRECFLTSNSGGGFTCAGAGDYFFLACASGIAGSSRPTITFFNGDCNVNLRNYSGGITLASMVATCDASVEGRGNLVLDASCTGGTVVIRGLFTLTSSGSGQTITDAARFAEDQSLASVAAIGTDGIDEGAMSVAVLTQIADYVIRRGAGAAQTSDDGDTPTLLSLYGLILSILNASATTNTLTTKHPSGTTLATATLSRDGNAQPIVGVDG